MQTWTTYDAYPQAVQGLAAGRARQMTVPAAKPDDLNPLPGIHMADCLPKDLSSRGTVYCLTS